MKRKKIIGIIVMFLIMLTMSSCGKNEEKEMKKIRIGYFPNITHAQALVMKNQEKLEKKFENQLEVSWHAFQAGPAEVEAIFAGEIDLGYIGPVPALSANVKSNGEIKIISNSTNAGTVLLIRKGSDIQSIQDLDGKKVAIPQLGNTQHLCLLNLLSENGLKTTDQGGDVIITPSSNADILNLMDQGNIDAALVPEPWGSIIENKGNASILLDANQIFLEGNYPTAVVVVNKEFYEENPEIVETFINLHENTTLYINQNLEKAGDIVNLEIEKVTGKKMEEDVIKSAFSRLNIKYDLNQEAIMKFGEISKKEGFIRELPEEEDVFTSKKHK